MEALHNTHKNDVVEDRTPASGSVHATDLEAQELDMYFQNWTQKVQKVH